jgi:hypothetical protein
MAGGVIIFILRICLIGVVWGFVWRLIEPKTRLARIFRAALLVVVLLVTLIVIRAFGA